MRRFLAQRGVVIDFQAQLDRERQTSSQHRSLKPFSFIVVGVATIVRLRAARFSSGELSYQIQISTSREVVLCQ